MAAVFVVEGPPRDVGFSRRRRNAKERNLKKVFRRTSLNVLETFRSSATLYGFNFLQFLNNQKNGRNVSWVRILTNEIGGAGSVTSAGASRARRREE